MPKSRLIGTSLPWTAAYGGDASRKQAHTNREGAVVKTFRTSQLMADVAILDDGLTHQQRESARIGCFIHLRDLTNRARGLIEALLLGSRSGSPRSSHG
jgi:hypothetical protein